MSSETPSLDGDLRTTPGTAPMGEPTRDRVNVTQLGGDAGMCRKCGVEAVEANERVTARKGAGVYPDTPSVVARQFFMRCPKCSDEWMLHEQAMQFERELSAVTFHEYRHITATLAARLTVLEQENADLRRQRSSLTPTEDA